MNPRFMSAVKFIGAWTCIVVAVVILVVMHQSLGSMGVVGWAALSIAFSQAPTSW